MLKNPLRKNCLNSVLKSWPVWTKEISEFQWEYDEKETCYILEGKMVVTPENGKPVSFGKGDACHLSERIKMHWKINSPVRKHYKIRMNRLNLQNISPLQI